MPSGRRGTRRGCSLIEGVSCLLPPSGSLGSEALDPGGGLSGDRAEPPPGSPTRLGLEYLTILAEAQGLPLLPLHQDADGAHTCVDEQHAQGGIQEEVDEVQ